MTSSKIQQLFIEATSPYNDGWTQCIAKRELWEYYQHLGELLEQCSSFPEDEKQWEEEWKKKKVARILSQ